MQTHYIQDESQNSEDSVIPSPHGRGRIGKSASYMFMGLFSLFLSAAAWGACTVNHVTEGFFPFENPHSAVISGDRNTIFIVDKTMPGIQVLDRKERKAVSTIELTGELFGLAINNAVKRLYVSGSFSGIVYIIDIDASAPSAFSVIASKKISRSGLGALAYDSVRDLLFAADRINDEIFVLSPADLSTVSPPLAGNSQTRYPYAMLIAGDTLYVSYEASGTVGVFDLSQPSPNLARTIFVDESPHELSISDDGASLYVANTAAISIIDTASRTIAGMIKDSDLLAAPLALTYLDGHLWIMNQKEGIATSLVQYDPDSGNLVASYTCSGIRQVNYLLALPRFGDRPDEMIVAYAAGVAMVTGNEKMRATVRQEDAVNYQWVSDIVAKPAELFDLRIEGGTGRFKIWGSGGMQVVSVTDRDWNISAPIPDGTHRFFIQDLGNDEKLDIDILVGGTLTVTPSGPLVMEQDGQSQIFSLSGGYPPYNWGVKIGLLSSATAREVIYTPRTAGEDTVTLRDAMGTKVSIAINIIVSGLSMTPLTTTMLPGERQEFQALNAMPSQYKWTAPQGGELSQLQGENTEFTAPAEPGDYLVVLTDTVTNNTAQAFIVVIDENMSVAPSERTVEREEAVDLRVEGGHGPYAWSARYGYLSSTQGKQVAYIAPDMAATDTISVQDNGGRIAVARITVRGTMTLSPAAATLEFGETVSFTLNQVSSQIKWQASAGELTNESKQGVGYVAPDTAGRYIVSAEDADGQRVQASIFVVSPNLSITPARIEMFTNDSVGFSVQGGASPYLWSTQMGMLSAAQGESVFLVAPDTAPPKPISLIVEDALGKLAVARITFKDAFSHLSYARFSFETGIFDLPAVTVSTPLGYQKLHVVFNLVPDLELLFRFHSAEPAGNDTLTFVSSYNDMTREIDIPHLEVEGFGAYRMKLAQEPGTELQFRVKSYQEIEE